MKVSEGKGQELSSALVNTLRRYGLVVIASDGVVKFSGQLVKEGIRSYFEELNSQTPEP